MGSKVVHKCDTDGIIDDPINKAEEQREQQHEHDEDPSCQFFPLARRSLAHRCIPPYLVKPGTHVPGTDCTYAGK